MAKGAKPKHDPTITPFVLPSAAAVSSAPLASPTAARFAALAAPAEPTMPKGADAPVLVLQSTATSFLDTQVLDDFTKSTVYVIETTGRTTSVHRTDAVTGQSHRAANLHWPKSAQRAAQQAAAKGKEAVAASGIRVQIGGGRWREAEEFLKFGSLFTCVLICRRGGSTMRLTCCPIATALASSICRTTATR
jgi:hypothetical protein